MKTIVIPTDFSDNAWNAISYALELFHATPCHFHIVNTYDPHTGNLTGVRASLGMGKLVESMKRISEEGILKTQRRLEDNHKNPKHTFEFKSTRNSVTGAIKMVQQKSKVDFIIMGTQGATGAKQIFMGSNAVKIIKSARNCPIIAIPNGYRFQAMKKVAFPTNFTHEYDKFELTPMIELATLWKSHIHIFQLGAVSLDDEQKLNQEMLKDRLQGLDYSFHEISVKTNVAEGIQMFSEAQEVDMVALMHYEHTFMEKLTREPVVKHVGFHTKVPLLVLPDL